MCVFNNCRRKHDAMMPHNLFSLITDRLMLHSSCISIPIYNVLLEVRIHLFVLHLSLNHLLVLKFWSAVFMNLPVNWKCCVKCSDNDWTNDKWDINNATCWIRQLSQTWKSMSVFCFSQLLLWFIPIAYMLDFDFEL